MVVIADDQFLSVDFLKYTIYLIAPRIEFQVTRIPFDLFDSVTVGATSVGTDFDADHAP